MLKFRLPVDIGNRGLDHIGGDAIDQTLGFTEPSRNALICGRVYDKLRRAELQRNTWRFAIRECVIRAIDGNTMLLVPSLYSGSTTYFVGSIVSDDTGTLWQSVQTNNLGNDPQNTPAWQEYFGTRTVPLWDTTGQTSYRAGELVYTTPGDGTNRVYMSIEDGNADNPATPTAWSGTVTYFTNQVVTENTTTYMSLIDFNLNQDPSLTFVAAWSAGTTYSSGQKATGSDGVIYQSSTNSNLNNNPTLDGGAHWTNTGVLSPWTKTFVSGAGSLNWRQIGGAEFPSGVTLTTLNLTYPPGVGPTTQLTTRNMFMLPAGFLRLAPQDPKAGSVSYLGAPSNMYDNDWEFQDKFLISRWASPISLRFVADTVDVTTFDDMFCEGLAARIGLEICEPLTQSTAKKQGAASEYEKFMREARLNNAILVGSEEPALDDWIVARL